MRAAGVRDSGKTHRRRALPLLQTARHSGPDSELFNAQPRVAVSAFMSPLRAALWGTVTLRPRAQVTLSCFNTQRFEGPGVPGGHQGVRLHDRPWPLTRRRRCQAVDRGGSQDWAEFLSPLDLSAPLPEAEARRERAPRSMLCPVCRTRCGVLVPERHAPQDLTAPCVLLSTLHCSGVAWDVPPVTAESWAPQRTQTQAPLPTAVSGAWRRCLLAIQTAGTFPEENI